MGIKFEDLKLNENGFIPAIAQDYKTGQVLMLAYMNREAFEKTLETGKVHYWSRSSNKLWLKGETSGHFQYVKQISLDCDSDTLLISVDQVDAACHTGSYSCFFRDIEGNTLNNAIKKPEETGLSDIIKELYDVITDRKLNPKEGSYTNYLFEKGLDKILKKVGEESGEVIIAGKNKVKDEIVWEISDLLYHLLVLMVDSGITLNDILNELKRRR